MSGRISSLTRAQNAIAKEKYKRRGAITANESDETRGRNEATVCTSDQFDLPVYMQRTQAGAHSAHKPLAVHTKHTCWRTQRT